MAQLYYKKVNYSPYRDRIPLQIVRAEAELSVEEKAYLSAVEKGDYASVKHALQEAEIYYNININCMDPLGRSALLIAIENENLEIMELLLSHSVYVGDALLYAIRKEVVGAVELLLNYRKPSGEKQVSQVFPFSCYLNKILCEESGAPQRRGCSRVRSRRALALNAQSGRGQLGLDDNFPG